MPPRKQRVEIPPDVAAWALFASDRTCCVCNDRNKPIQLHHIDGDPGNSISENLAVLCFECHHKTQIRGGFDRKLDALQVELYKQNWLKTVEARRDKEKQPTVLRPYGDGPSLRYVQIAESSDDNMYDFGADYTLVRSADQLADKGTNALIEAHITRRLQRFRADAIANTPNKVAQKKKGFNATAWDSLGITHSVSLFMPRILSLEFHVYSYSAGAAHPNTQTDTLNISLLDSTQLEIHNIFKPSTNYLEIISQYCIEDLHKQQPQRWHDPLARANELESHRDHWILEGAGPRARNFESISFRRNGFVIHFDPYQVGSYAEGKYEVFVPYYLVRPVLEEEVAALLE